MPQTESNECFVVMPFGKKPFPADSGSSYDFDKVYRVLIQRAIREAGMKPVRADERKGSGLIHSEMFKDLRDRAVSIVKLTGQSQYQFTIFPNRYSSGTGYLLPFCKRPGT